MIRRKNNLILSFDRPISQQIMEKDFICNHLIRLEGVSYSFLDGFKRLGESLGWLAAFS